MIENEAVFSDLTRRTLELLGIQKERRRDRRVRLTIPLVARIGHTDALVVDLSARGARLRHYKPLKPGTEARLTFDWPGGPLRALARVLASSLIAAAPRSKFESRLQFLEVSPQSKKLLERAIRTLSDAQLRLWIANFMGDVVYPYESRLDDPRALLRFRLENGRWSAGPAKPEEPPPADGFIVPASIEPGEINVLCAEYSRLDRDGQQLLRLFATAALAA